MRLEAYLIALSILVIGALGLASTSKSQRLALQSSHVQQTWASDVREMSHLLGKRETCATLMASWPALERTVQLTTEASFQPFEIPFSPNELRFDTDLVFPRGLSSNRAYTLTDWRFRATSVSFAGPTPQLNLVVELTAERQGGGPLGKLPLVARVPFSVRTVATGPDRYRLSECVVETRPSLSNYDSFCTAVGGIYVVSKQTCEFSQFQVTRSPGSAFSPPPLNSLAVGSEMLSGHAFLNVQPDSSIDTLSFGAGTFYQTRFFDIGQSWLESVKFLGPEQASGCASAGFIPGPVGVVNRSFSRRMLLGFGPQGAICGDQVGWSLEPFREVEEGRTVPNAYPIYGGLSQLSPEQNRFRNLQGTLGVTITPSATNLTLASTVANPAGINPFAAQAFACTGANEALYGFDFTAAAPAPICRRPEASCTQAGECDQICIGDDCRKSWKPAEPVPCTWGFQIYSENSRCREDFVAFSPADDDTCSSSVGASQTYRCGSQGEWIPAGCLSATDTNYPSTVCGG
ncbi:MAG: hypothetical protein AB7P04_05620 [Bacteriovoracia bacterium]